MDYYKSLINDLASTLESKNVSSDPVAWAKHRLNIDLWEKQREIAYSVLLYPETYVASCFGSGKSFCSAVLTAWFVDTFGEEGWVVTTAPSNAQVYAILWQEIKRLGRMGNLPGRIQTRDWKIGKPGKEDILVAFGRSPKDYDPASFQGIHRRNVLVILDEAPGISPQIWEAVRGLMTSENCRLLAIGNPIDSSGPFYQVYLTWQKEILEGRKRETNFIRINAFLTPNFQGIKYSEPPTDTFGQIKWKEDMIKQLEEIYDRPLVYSELTKPRWALQQLRRLDINHPYFESKVLGMFPRTLSDAVIPWLWVDDSKRNWTEYMRDLSNAGENLSGDTYIGVDPARFGDNETVIVTRTRNIVHNIQYYNKTDGPFIANAVREEILRCNAKGMNVRNIRIDEPGIGGMLIDFMKRSGMYPPILSVNTGRQAKNKFHYFNLRAELWWKMRDKLDPSSPNRILLMPDEEACTQLIAPKFEYTTKQQYQVEEKADLRDRGVPDIGRADAIILACMDESDLPQGLDMDNFNIRANRPISIWQR